jgi:type I restriction enzyme S subunit
MLISKIENFVLPQGWSRCCLPDFTDIVMGQSPTSDTYNKSGSGIPFFQGKAEFGAIYPTVSKYCSAPNKIALAGATLLSVRAPVGPTNLAKERCCIGRGLAAIHPVGGISPMFILFLLRSIETDLSKEGTGSTFSAINKQFVEELEFGLPPLPEQRRIVAKMEELFSELDKGIENLKTARAQLKVYRQALLKHAFAGKYLVQKRITPRPFGEESMFTLGYFIHTLGQGWSPRCLESPSQSDGVWGVIKTTAIQPLYFDDAQNKQLPSGLAPRQQLEIIPGDVLITRAGPRTRVGIACFVKNTRPRLMVCDKAYRLQIHKERILPQYLVMLLNTSEVLSELEKLKSGISDSGLNLTQDKFLMLKIRVPTLEHQKIILEDIEEKLSEVDQLDQTITTSLKQAEALRQSILKKAFAGQLVTQDANDEPASVLLARIKAEKTAQAATAKPRKKLQEARTQAVPAKPNVIPFPVKIGNISTTDLHAGIIAMAYQRHEQSPEFLKHFHHVKAEKISHLVEAHLGIDLERVPFKDVAGPNDYLHLKKVESRARKANWFDVHQRTNDGAYIYTKKHSFDALIGRAGNALGERIAGVDALLELLLPLNTRQTEIVATLYAAWNNLLLLGHSPQDEDIIYEARENWHESKLKIEREKFFRGLEWMRNQGLVPAGRGRYVSWKGKRQTTGKPI